MSALKGMFSFFTMIRLDITEKDMDDMDRRFCLAPVVGIFYGSIAAALMFLLNEAIPPLAAAVLTLFAIQAINRFLHIDGTIDVGDGLVVAGTREDHLRALKDTRIGAGGMAFALFVVILTAAALSGISGDLIILAPFAAEVLAKNSMVSAAGFGRPGEGMAGASVRHTGMKSVLASTVISTAAILAMAVALWWMGRFDDILRVTALMVSVIIVSVLTGAAMSKIAERNFGMTNGDVLGATNEMSRVITLILILAIIPVI